MITCWSPKGGTGVSVFAALLAIYLGRSAQRSVLVDTAGDQPALFGLSQPSVGFEQWAGAGNVSAASVRRVVVPATDGVELLASGRSTGVSTFPPGCDERVREAFPDRRIVVDAGLVRSAADERASLVMSADTSLLVMRTCYLAAYRASISDLKPSGIVLVEEAGRSLSAGDIEDVLGAPVLLTMPWDVAIARAVDAGRLSGRLPKATKCVEPLAVQLAEGRAARHAS